MKISACLYAILITSLVACNKKTEKRAQLFLSNNYTLFQNHGITKNPFQINFLTANKKIFYLVIENPHINNIIIKNKQSDTLYNTGDKYPFTNRSFNHRFFVFEIPKKIKIPDSLQLILDKSGENLSYHIKVLDSLSLYEYLFKDYFIIGFIVGSYVLMIFLSLALLYYYKKLKYFYFWLFVVASMIWILNDAGLFFEHLWPNSPNWHKSSRGLFSSLSMILFALYLSKNENRFFSKALSTVIILIAGLMLLKFLLAIVTSFGLYPDSIKYASMHLNAIVLLTLFGLLLLYLVINFDKYKIDGFEIAAIIVYCFFVIHLSLKELGYSIIDVNFSHQFDAMYFFPFQFACMYIHLYKKEKESKIASERELIQFKIEQQRIIDKKIFEVEENEKKRIAQNIHDEIGSIFVSLKYQILSFKEKFRIQTPKEEFDKLLKLTEKGIDKQYSIIDDLLFEFNSGKSLESEINKHFELMVNREDIAFNFVFKVNEKKLNDFQKTQIFRILTELFTNSIKHANASLITLSFIENSFLDIEYRDNGNGFRPDNVVKGRGIENIRMRTHALNGTVMCKSDNTGTTYSFKIIFNNE